LNGSSSSSVGGAGAGACATALTVLACGLAATAAARFGPADELAADGLFPDARLAATGAFAPAACGCAVAPDPITTAAPHTGQRALLPSDPAGAVSFFPHAQRICIGPATDMLHHLSTNRSIRFEPPISNNRCGLAQWNYQKANAAPSAIGCSRLTVIANKSLDGLSHHQRLSDQIEKLSTDS